MLKEVIIESFESIKKNKLRSILTGFGIAWGIFILTLLLSISDSFDTGVKNVLGGLNSRDIFYEGGTVTKVDIGAITGSKITFDQALLEKLTQKLGHQIKYLSPVRTYTPTQPLKRKGFFTQSEVKGISTDYFEIDHKKIVHGRLLNGRDVSIARKVVILGLKTAEKLFDHPKNSIGKSIFIENNWFKVVGIYKSASPFDFLNAAEVIVPATAMQEFLTKNETFSTFRVLPDPSVNPERLEKKITAFLATQRNFNKHDKNAVRVINSYKDSQEFRQLITGLTVFLWFVGISLLITGVIGISNIMYITVKERTKEIGVRKALGANPNAITRMFLIEALLITNFSGGIGFMTSYVVLKIIDWAFVSADSILGAISINFFNAIATFLLLVICGSLAGVFPAKKAAGIRPIVAIRYNE